MSRVGKFMVFNPLKNKPRKFYSTFERAIADAESVSEREKEDVLVLEVVGKVETQEFLHKKITNKYGEVVTKQEEQENIPF